MEEAAGSGWYWISDFYVSRALQGAGLGRAAMDTVESIAISEPLNAKVLGLNSINKVDEGREPKYEALGIVLPLVSAG
jgi:GNAT superfamily N-acetyltransferase